MQVYMVGLDIKETIQARIVDFYLSSHDFNGLPAYNLVKILASTKDQIVNALSELVSDGHVIAMHQDFDVNIHILRVEPPQIKYQLEKIGDLTKLCLYPTSIVLEKMVDRNQYSNEPYRLALALGSPQLAYRSFDLSILEVYRNDPRYRYENDDIRGSISYSYQTEDLDPEDENRDYVFLQTFGFSYDDDFNRGVAVFIRYLADLSPEHQQIWRAKEIEGNYKLHPDYYENTILGNWGTKLGLLEAFLLELKVINEMAITIKGIRLFREDFWEARPREFSFLVRPTLKEFNDFVLLLDKMISENIDRDFFRGVVSFEVEEIRDDGKSIVRPKGTISMLEEWINNSYQTSDREPLIRMITIFRDIRTQRQKPAHVINENQFDPLYFKRQREMMLEAYEAIRLLRLLLANHPRAKTVEVPDPLFKGEIWPM